jgi:hypothetical protein
LIAAISFGELLTNFDPEISEWGNPHEVMLMYPYPNTYDMREELGELKHLSSQRKKNQLRFP